MLEYLYIYISNDKNKYLQIHIVDPIKVPIADMMIILRIQILSHMEDRPTVNSYGVT